MPTREKEILLIVVSYLLKQYAALYNLLKQYAVLYNL